MVHFHSHNRHRGREIIPFIASLPKYLPTTNAGPNKAQALGSPCWSPSCMVEMQLSYHHLLSPMTCTSKKLEEETVKAGFELTPDTGGGYPKQ